MPRCVLTFLKLSSSNKADSIFGECVHAFQGQKPQHEPTLRLNDSKTEQGTDNHQKGQVQATQTP